MNVIWPVEMVDCAPTPSISTLSLSPHDLLVVRLKGRMTQEESERIGRSIKPCLPTGTSAIVVDDDVELSVIAGGRA